MTVSIYYPSENLKMPFYFLCCHGKFVTMSVMLTYCMLQIGFTKINFCHVSFALIFKIRVTYMADCQVISYQLEYQNNCLLKGSALSLRT